MYSDEARKLSGHGRLVTLFPILPELSITASKVPLVMYTAEIATSHTNNENFSMRDKNCLDTLWNLIL